MLRGDFGPARRPAVLRGVAAVAKLARAPRGAQLHPVLVNGTVGAVATIDGQPFTVLAFTVVNCEIGEIGEIVEIGGIRDPDRVRLLAAAILTEGRWPAWCSSGRLTRSATDGCGSGRADA